MKMKTPLGLTFCLLLSFHFTFAQFSNDTTANSVMWDSAGTEQLTPLIATTDAGNTYISWFDSQSSPNPYELRMQLLDPNGNKLWGPDGKSICNFPQNTAIFRYDLKVDRENNAIVAFQDERFTDLKIVAYKVDQSGNLLWGTNGVELSDSTAQGLAPTIGITNANEYIIAWHADYGSSKWISFQKISSTGTILWSKRIFDSSNTNKYSKAQIVPYGNDDFIMQYVEETGSFPGVTSTLFAQHYDSNGDEVWINPVQVSTKTIPFFVFPTIVSDNKNGFFIVFNTSNPINLSLNDVYAQHVDSSGNLWSPTGTELANSTTEHKSTGGFCFNSTNNELYIALQVLDGGQGSSGVSVQAVDSNGLVLFGPNGIQLKNIDPIYYNPHAIVDAGDGLISIFSYGGFGNQHLAAIKTDYTGVLAWGYEPTICNYNSNKDDLSAGLFKNDQTVIVFQDDRIDYGIYMQNLRGDGTFGIFTSLNQLSTVDYVKLYPNPSPNPSIQITSSKNEEVILKVLNPEGKECLKSNYFLSPGLNEISINNKQLKSGLYFINIYSENKITRTKWIKP